MMCRRHSEAVRGGSVERSSMGSWSQEPTLGQWRIIVGALSRSVSDGCFRKVTLTAVWRSWQPEMVVT